MEFIRYNQFVNVVGVTSLRTNGVSKGPYESLNLALQVNDDYDNVMKNREIFFNKLGVDINNSVFMYQTHSINIQKVDFSDAKKGLNEFKDGVYDVDGIYTYEPNLVLCSLHADCVPLFFYDKEKKFVGVIHAGWQGTLKYATKHMLKKVIEDEKVDIKNLYVYLGPNIQDQLLIDDEVKELMTNVKVPSECIVKKDDKYYLDIEKMNVIQLKELGITNIELSGRNTYNEPELFFSFNRDNKVCGRHISAIYKVK